jgi:hypothetical protein
VMTFREPVVDLTGGSSLLVFSDWFLPSKDELNQMYINLHLFGVGGFSITRDYVTSSEGAADSYMAQSFGDGSQYLNNKIDTADAVRPCRAFTSVTSYALKDVGPAGGFIFWKSGNNYLEATSADQFGVSHAAWSNISGLLVGTAMAIGTGQANTTAIINQAGHTSSIAKLCDDLIIVNRGNDIGYSFDKIPFSYFGIYLSKPESLHDLPELKEQFFTKYGSEGYQIVKRKNKTFDFNGFIIGNSLADFQDKIKALYLLFSSSGTRQVKLNNEIYVECFATEGFKVENIYLYNNMVIANIKISLICVKVLYIRELIDDDNYGILTEAGETILV